MGSAVGPRLSEQLLGSRRQLLPGRCWEKWRMASEGAAGQACVVAGVPRMTPRAPLDGLTQGSLDRKEAVQTRGVRRCVPS